VRMLCSIWSRRQQRSTWLLIAPVSPSLSLSPLHGSLRDGRPNYNVLQCLAKRRNARMNSGAGERSKRNDTIWLAHLIQTGLLNLAQDHAPDPSRGSPVHLSFLSPPLASSTSVKSFPFQLISSYLEKQPMSPPSEIFDAAELPDRVRFNEKGKFRKTTLDDGSGARGIDLRRCALLQMLQYHCTVDEPRTRDSPTRCYPVPRLFRRYVLLPSRLD
jgi:hypothetical protein